MTADHHDVEKNAHLLKAVHFMARRMKPADEPEITRIFNRALNESENQRRHGQHAQAVLTLNRARRDLSQIALLT